MVSVADCKAYLNGALVGGKVLGGGCRAVHQEASALDLTLGVEGDQTDVCVGEGLHAVGDLAKHLAGVGASEHGQLVHSPVPGRKHMTLRTQ